MAKKLKSYKRKSRPGPADTYPWDQWLNGETWELTQGTDFKCEISTMADNIRRHARERDLSISVFREDETTIVICPREI